VVAARLCKSLRQWVGCLSIKTVLANPHPHPAPKSRTMKAVLSLLATIAFSGILAVLGNPTPQITTDVISIHAPEGFTPPEIIEPSVDGSVLEKHAVAAAAQYWVCVAISRSTLQYGWSQGGSYDASLRAAKGKCGRSDCTFYQCIERGCVGLVYGTNSAWLSYASGYGRDDARKAKDLALSKCRKSGSRCGTPGSFCARYIV
jgi:hypothetical protein